jgi:hypothetical protein
MLRLGVFDGAFLYGFVFVGSFVFCYKGICMDHPCIQLEAFWEYGFFKV